MARFTIQELARRTGYSTATVSRALSGKGRMLPSTRDEISAAAAKVGYQPLPSLSKAFSLIRQPEIIPFRESLAIITEHHKAGEKEYHAKLQSGAEARASSMGYQIESFSLSSLPSHHRKLSGILQARGIRGLIIFPRFTQCVARLALDWPHFIGVEIGRTIRMPHNLHRVERPLYYELIEAFHSLKKAGFRRIGLAASPHENSQRRGIFVASYLMAQEKLPRAKRIPPLNSCGKWGRHSLVRWLNRYEPDVVICSNPLEVPGWIESLGFEIPQDISIFCTNVGDSKFSGFRCDLEGIGAACVEMLSVLLNGNTTGLSAQPRTWLLPDLWEPGETLRYPLEATF